MPKLFVIMPFGSKGAGEGDGVFDFDALHSQVIEPAGRDAGFEVVRMDLVSTPGRISEQFLKELYLADVALGDVTLPNANVFYEIGIRQTMGSGPTVLIARADVPLPFDFRDQRVVLYSPGALADAKKRIGEVLASVLREPGQNPVQQFLNSIGVTTSPTDDRAAFEQDLRSRIDRARNANQLIAIWSWVQQFEQLPALTLATLADRLADEKEWALAADVLRVALRRRPNDFELHRSLGFYLRNTGLYEEAEKSLRRALELNASDPETLGILGGLLKRQGRFEEAAEAYRRGSDIAPGNVYLRNNQLGMGLLVKTELRDQVLESYRELLNDLFALPPEKKDEWTECMIGEAYFVLGDDERARRHLEAAARLAKSPNVLLSPADQFDLLAKHGFRPQESAAMAAWLRQGTTAATVGATGTNRAEATPATPATACPVLIHLSDVHFGWTMKNGKRVRMHRFYDGDYEKTLIAHLKREFTSKSRRFSLDGRQGFLIVSGDLTYTATAEEFAEGREFLEQLCECLKIPKERVTLCPGNHDVNWAESNIDLSRRFDQYIYFLNEFYGEELFRRLYPEIKWDLKGNTKRPDPSDLMSLQVFPAEKLLFLSLNSCVYETPVHHYGYVGGKQLDKVRTALDESGVDGLVRVAVVHHHLHAFPEAVVIQAEGDHWQDLSSMRDSALVENDLLRQKFDLVFHGHKHKAQLRETALWDPGPGETARPLIVFGGGSCGVNSEELEHAEPNQYEVVEILHAPRPKGCDFLRVERREIAVKPRAEWVTARTWTLQG
ncbi:MAG TPA: tetratricopeptide repeat protein [Candidatus Acidoferrales bacterium]|nr:tetratricopeptide repeat protein [Candidatus Acidoferrales bacterium]